MLMLRRLVEVLLMPIEARGTLGKGSLGRSDAFDEYSRCLYVEKRT
jgi:hypothetical protein